MAGIEASSRFDSYSRSFLAYNRWRIFLAVFAYKRQAISRSIPYSPVSTMRIGLLLLLLGLCALPARAQPFTVNEYMGLGTVGQYAYLRGYIDGYGTAAVPPSTAATVMEPAAAARADEF